MTLKSPFGESSIKFFFVFFVYYRSCKFSPYFHTMSSITQIFEKLIYNQLINYIEKFNILYEYQFGFRKGHSTAQAIAEITDNLKLAIDNFYTCGIFLNFSKVFDMVNQNILLKKMESYGVRRIPLN